MWSDMALDGGQSLLQRGLSFIGAKREAKAKKAWQKYRNSMLQLSDANNQNSLTINEMLLNQRDAEQKFQIERSEYVTKGAAEAAAAASGTGGRSVNAVLFDIERNAATAQRNREADLQAQYLSIDNQRRQSAFQAATQMDYSPIPTPSLATEMLGFATDLRKIQKEYQR